MDLMYVQVRIFVKAEEEGVEIRLHNIIYKALKKWKVP